MRSTLALLLILAAPASAHDLSQHGDLPYLAADCAGYYGALSRLGPEADRAQAATRAAQLLKSAKARAPETAADLDYIVDAATRRARQQIKDALGMDGAARLLREQKTFCDGVNAALQAPGITQ